MSQRPTSHEASSDLKQINLKNGNCSGAEFFLFQSDTGPILRKQITGKTTKLLEQYHWLKTHSEFDFIPPVFNPLEGENTFSYDMPFYENAKNAFDCLTSKDSSFLLKILEATVQLKEKTVKIDESKIETYFQTKLEEKLSACSVNSHLNFNTENSICGTRYPSINNLIIQLKEKLPILKGAENYEIHGDLTLENILVDGDKPIFIDPNGENLVSSVEVELAKLFQSLHSHYEELSSNKTNLCDILEREPQALFLELKNYIQLNHGEDALARTYFHEVFHIARLLPYKMINQKELFQEFLDLFIVRSSQFLGMVN